MDLVSTVRKEGSRGGRGNFQWSEVAGSSHRENYLGHSLMAPVGRWQKGRDLSWYAKGDKEDGEDAEQAAARQREEEIRRIKEAEQEALAKALGYEIPPIRNANLEPLGDPKGLPPSEVPAESKDLSGRGAKDERRERREKHRSRRDDRDRRRSRSRSCNRHHRRHRREHRDRDRSRSRDTYRGSDTRRRHSRSRSKDRDRHEASHRRRQNRSYSPPRSGRDRYGPS